MSREQETKAPENPAPEAAPAADPGQDLETLANALSFEREKNEVLLNEVVALEDELVDRQLGMRKFNLLEAA